jgi:hypothetical protein
MRSDYSYTDSPAVLTISPALSSTTPHTGTYLTPCANSSLLFSALSPP